MIVNGGKCLVTGPYNVHLSLWILRFHFLLWIGRPGEQSRIGKRVKKHEVLNFS